MLSQGCIHRRHHPLSKVGRRGRAEEAERVDRRRCLLSPARRSRCRIAVADPSPIGRAHIVQANITRDRTPPSGIQTRRVLSTANSLSSLVAIESPRRCPTGLVNWRAAAISRRAFECLERRAQATPSRMSWWRPDRYIGLAFHGPRHGHTPVARQCRRMTPSRGRSISPCAKPRAPADPHTSCHGECKWLPIALAPRVSTDR